MVIFNWRGMVPILAMLALGVAIGSICEKGLGMKIGRGGIPEATALGSVLIFIALGMIAYDVWYRRSNLEKAMFHPFKGGHIFFIASWIVGIFVGAIGVLFVIAGSMGG